MSKLLRYFGLVVAVCMAAILLACSTAEEPAGPVEAEQTASPSQTQTESPVQTPDSTSAETASDSPTQTPPDGRATADGYDSTENMFLLYNRRNHNPVDSNEAIELAVANKDKSMVPVLIEILRFFRNTALESVTMRAITDITGHELTGDRGVWHEWMEWLGRNADEYSPPDGYVDWKIILMNMIDPRFEEFLAPAKQGSRINVHEIAWGGVRPDGIPDLQSAPVVSADEQDYLHPTDRVFGVSINGEHRAYPLRIVNAHEMANDVLGGEPIALAY